MTAKILVICCNWNGWSCFESAADSGLHYPASVKVMRVSCLSRIHTGLILRAFEFSADGVMLAGCEPGSCQFNADSERINREYEKTRNILEMLGICQDRLAMFQLPAFDGQQLITQIIKFTGEIERMTPKRSRKASVKVA